MGVLLASYANKTTSTAEAELTVPADGVVQFLLHGNPGDRAVVKVLLKTANTNFTEFPELTFYKKTAVQFNVLKDDQIKVQFFDCVAANADVRHWSL